MSSSASLGAHRAPPMDPRIKARRIEVRRHEGRRRLQRLVDLGAILVVALAFAAALRSPLLDVDRIEIVGAQRTGVDAVLADLGFGRGDPLMDVDLAEAGARIAQLPWVAEVELDRGLDGLVRVALAERIPIAVVAGPDGDLLVDADGRVLGPVADAGSEAAALVRVVGPEAPPPGRHLDADLAGVLAMAGSLATNAPGAIVEVAVSGGDVRALLTTGGEVRFGDGSQLDAKVRSFVTMIEQVDLACLAELDLRLPGSPVLTREVSCS